MPVVTTAELRCPHCGRPVATGGPHRPASFPFCTQRCRLLDLGAWFDGRNHVPGGPADPAYPDEDA